MKASSEMLDEDMDIDTRTPAGRLRMYAQDKAVPVSLKTGAAPSSVPGMREIL
jgi:hypothetical protein